MADGTHVIAWDGVEFVVPFDWDVARFEFEKQVTRLFLEDDLSERMRVEWVRTARLPKVDKVRAKMDSQAKALRKSCSSHQPLELQAEGWGATEFAMSSGERVVVCHGALAGEDALILLLIVRFDPEDATAAGPLVRRIAASLHQQTGSTTRWAIYDMDLRVPEKFVLHETRLEAGRKLLVFRHRMRRLQIWQFSMAKLLLKDADPATWCAKFLAANKVFRGPRFVAVGEEVQARRNVWRPLGHGQEIGRWCFKYKVAWWIDAQTNHLHIWVYQHRRARDLDWWDDHIAQHKGSSRA